MANDIVEGDYDVGDYSITIFDDGRITINKYYGTAKNLIIPSEIEGFPVVYIGPLSFYNCTSLESVTIPDSVIWIEGDAFSHCSHLVSVTLSDSVTYIGMQAFNACEKLTSIIIPDSVTSFENVTSLNGRYYL